MVVFLLIISLIKTKNTQAKANVTEINSTNEFMSNIEKVRNELLSMKPISVNDYLNSLQISYGRNRQPNVISYGLTSPTFSFENVSSSSSSNSLANIGNDTSIIEFEVKILS